MFCTACGTAPQPESAKTVAAFEVPLPTQPERDQFLSLLRQVAQTEGLHVDAASARELQQTARDVPLAKMTLHAAVWRGSNDGESEAVIMDQADHLGQVWIMFSKGRDPLLATKFRDKAVKAIFARWPKTLSLPIMPTGAIPLHDDLVKTAGGYKVAASAAARYAKDAK
jgi:hypothetical protein